jgi:isopentenyl-diphosphate Delta-isomerase
MEQVILVNELDEPVGIMEKMQAHEVAVLHRAFSVFIFNASGEMLLQQRASTKYHSAGLWTNACCSHPRPAENTLAAAHRRLLEELGFDTPLTKIFHFTYKADFSNGLVEHEFDHVFAGQYSGSITANTDEVSNYGYYQMQHIDHELKLNPEKYTAWFHVAFPKIKEWWQLKQANTNA